MNEMQSVMDEERMIPLVNTRKSAKQNTTL